MSSHSGNLNYCLVVDGLYRNYKEGRKKKKNNTVVFRAVCSGWTIAQGSFRTTNNKDVISDNPATLELMFPALDAAGWLLRSLEGRHTPSHDQRAKQCKLKNKIKLNKRAIVFKRGSQSWEKNTPCLGKLQMYMLLRLFSLFCSYKNNWKCMNGSFIATLSNLHMATEAILHSRRKETVDILKHMYCSLGWKQAVMKDYELGSQHVQTHTYPFSPDS